LNLPYLEEQEKQKLEGEISIDEVLQALNGFQNHKTPGNDGFTKEFYEATALLESFRMQGSKIENYLYHKKGESFH